MEENDFEDPEIRPLVPKNVTSTISAADSRIKESNADLYYRNFIIMCVSFSINHGCVVSCLAYATAQLGNSLGGYGSGCLYILYSLTAFLLSKPTVVMIGPKNGLFVGTLGYCIYIAGFLMAILLPKIKWPVFIIAACIGGVSGGLLWPSQGRYFARNAKLYSEFTDIPIEKVNSTFAGIFASCYLGFEMLTKVLATIIFLVFPDIAYYLIFSIYTILAALACIGISSIHELEEYGTWNFSYEAIINNTLSVGKFLMEDIRLSLMIPFQVTFGFTSSFVPYYIFGTVIAKSQELGSAYVGLLSAIIVLAGALIAMPSSYVSNIAGKPVVMSFGGACLAFAGFSLYILSDSQLGTWKLIIPYLAIYGIGRGTWENTNKAVIADMFSESADSISAFSAVAFSNGLAGAVGYFTFSSIGRTGMITIITITAFIAVLCYLYAEYIHQFRKNMRAI